MKKLKLKLDLDSLEVESFNSSEVRDEGGTVRGHSGVDNESCACTVIAHYCYPNSNIMDCVDSANRSCFGDCYVTPP